MTDPDPQDLIEAAQIRDSSAMLHTLMETERESWMCRDRDEAFELRKQARRNQ